VNGPQESSAHLLAAAIEISRRSRREQGLPEKVTGAQLRRLVRLELAVLCEIPPRDGDSPRVELVVTPGEDGEDLDPFDQAP
jgi:hypothetical protein